VTDGEITASLITRKLLLETGMLRSRKTSPDIGDARNNQPQKKQKEEKKGIFLQESRRTLKSIKRGKKQSKRNATFSLAYHPRQCSRRRKRKSRREMGGGGTGLGFTNLLDDQASGLF